MADRRKSQAQTGARKSSGFRWKRAGLIGGLVLLVLLVMGAFGAFLAIKAYLRSDSFRGLLGELTSGAFKADGEFEAFSWNGATVYSDAFDGRGYEDADFSRVKASGIEAEVSLSGVRRGVWDIVRVDIQQMNVLVDGDRLKRPPATGADEEEAEAVAPTGFFRGLIPDKVEIRRTRVSNVNFDLMSGQTRALGGRGISIEVTPTSTEKVFKITGWDGELEVMSLPGDLRRLTVGDFILRPTPDGIYVDNATFKFTGASPGAAFVTGLMGTGGQRNVDLHVKFSDVPAEAVLPSDWSRRLSGRCGGDLEITGDPSEVAGPRVGGRVELTEGVLEALPVLDRIDKFAGTTRFRRLLISDLHVSFDRRGNELDVSEFLVEAAGTACVQGHLDFEGSQVNQGQYLIGVAPDVIKWLPEWKKKIIEQVFRLERDEAFGQVFPSSKEVNRPPEGYRWMVATVDPVSTDPYSADIRRQFVEAGGLAIWAELEGLSQQAIAVAEEVAKTASDQGVKLLDVFTGDRESMLFSEDGLLQLRKKGGGGLLDLPESFIKGGLDTLNGLNPFGPGRR